MEIMRHPPRQFYPPNASILYDEVLELARKDPRLFVNFRAHRLNLEFSAMNEQACEIVRLAKPALKDARVEFRYRKGEFNDADALGTYLDTVLLPTLGSVHHFELFGVNLPSPAPPASAHNLMKRALLAGASAVAITLWNNEGTHVFQDPPSMVTAKEVLDWLHEEGGGEEKYLYLGEGIVQAELIQRITTVWEGDGWFFKSAFLK